MAEPTNNLRYLFRACRACLGTSFTESVSLQQEYWLEQYKYCTNAEIPDEQVPHLLLCGKCAVMVKCYAEFKRKCAQSEEFWHAPIRQKVECKQERKTTPLECPPTGNTEPLNNTANAPEHKVQTTNQLNFETEIIVQREDNGISQGIKLERSFCENDESDSERHNLQVKDENDKKSMINRVPIEPVPRRVLRKRTIKSEPISLNRGTTRQSVSRIRKKRKRVIPKVLKKRERKYTCDMCGINFWLKKTIIQHMQQRHNPNGCGLCDFKADYTAEVTKHVVQEHYNNNELKCRLCDYEGLDFACMISHRLKHINMPSKNVLCILCGHLNRADTSAEFHFRKAHLGKPGGLCHICHKLIKCELHWKKHVYFHTGGFSCPEKGCNYQTKKKERLEMHLRNHPPLKTMVCEICAYVTYKSANLEAHKKRHHMPVEKVICNICGKSFSAENLKNHLKLHGEERPFKCPSCPKAYLSAHKLRDHQLQHTVPDSKPHECDICGRRYSWRRGMLSHRAQHASEHTSQGAQASCNNSV